MATIKRETTVATTSDQIWASLIKDPNTWTSWLTPLRGLEGRADAPVRAGQKFSARIGNVSGQIRVAEAREGKKLRWRAGPGPLLAMGMGMKGTLEFTPAGNGSTKVDLTMKSPPMIGGMMKMMTGLKPKDEMTKTIARIKELSEK